MSWSMSMRKPRLELEKQSKEASTMSEEKALVKVEDFIFPVLSDDLGEAMSEEMDGLSIEFDRVKIPSGGGLAFEVLGDVSDAPDVVKELEGVIFDHYLVYSFGSDRYLGHNNSTDC